MLSHLFSDQNMGACIAVGLCLWSNNIWGIGLLCMPTRMAVEPTCQLAKAKEINRVPCFQYLWVCYTCENMQIVFHG